MNRNKLLILSITVLLFFIPFFWFRPGEADLGGDSSRLYFYDPIAYLHSQPLYGITTSGIGGEAISYFGIPYVLLLAFVKSIVGSTTFLVNIFQGITLSLGFLFIYLIVKDLLLNTPGSRKKYIEPSAILAGLFYVFSPSLILGWDKAILTHNQFFLNPLIFFLFLRFLTRDNFKYLAAALIISFIFAQNFSFVAAPPFFAFYPLAITFMLLYVILILKKPLPYKKILIGLGLFFLVHLFHLGTHLVSLFSGGSEINNAVFSSEAKYSRGLSYFSAIAPSVKVSYSLMKLPQMTELGIFSFLFIIFPAILLIGFIWNRSRLYLLTALFYLITLFFISANITDAGLRFYKSLFDIPGFSMFRNFFGQWIFIYTFFYALLLGQALYFLFNNIKNRYAFIISGLILIVLIGNAVPFITGELVNKVHHQSKNIKVPSEIDPEYEKVLSYIRNLPQDGKFISFPLSGPGYQTLMGKNGGAYQGPSTITYLTGKNDFTGYDGLHPYSEVFLKLVENNDIQGINRLFSILNIKYVFYNSDPLIYDSTFPRYPYDYVRDYMPKTQNGYKLFIEKLPVKKVKSFGTKYHIYEVENFLPHFYLADNEIYASDALTPYFSLDTDASLRSVVYNTGQLSPAKDAPVILEAINSNPLNELVNNYHLHVHNPFISRRQDDIFYPIVVWREKRAVAAKSEIPNDYLDFSLFHLSKRILELEQFKKTPITHTEFIKPEIWEVHKWKDYYSWESNLSRYERDMNQLIAWVPTAEVSESTKYAMKIKINQNISQHESHLTRIINESEYIEKDRQYLRSLKKRVFTGLHDTLAIKPLDPAQILYTIDLPNDSSGKYDVFVKSQKDESLDPSRYKIRVNDELILPITETSSSSLLQFNTVTLSGNDISAVLQIQPKNLIEKSQWIGTGSHNKRENETTLNINNQFKNGIYALKVDGYSPKKQYVVTFDYYTENTDILFRLFEKQKENNKSSTASYFNKNLSSSAWKTYQAVLTSSPNAQSGFIQFLIKGDDESGILHIRNITVVEVPNERILFKKVVPENIQTVLPSIHFTKLNPTLYRIQVSGADSPYSLVFSEAFNNKWKLSLNNSAKVDMEDVSATYFHGQVREGKHTNSYFESAKLLGNITEPIAADRHLSGNGYANVWNIRPEDVGGKKEYVLQLEYEPQKYTVVYLGISFVTILFLLLYMLVYKKRK